MMNIISKFEKTPQGRKAMTIARIKGDALRSLRRGMLNSGKTQSDLARDLGKTRSAVNQVISGDGNVKLATLAEYLFAMDLKLELNVVPLSKGTDSSGTAVPIVSKAARSASVREVSAQAAKFQALSALSFKSLGVAFDAGKLHSISGNQLSIKVNSEGKYEFHLNVDGASLWQVTSKPATEAVATWQTNEMDFVPIDWTKDTPGNTDQGQAWGRVSNYGN